MAEPLKNHFGPAVPRKLVSMLSKRHPPLKESDFLRDALEGYEQLELIPRARHLSQVLRKHLPDDYPSALSIIVESLDTELDHMPKSGMSSFLYLPFVFFVSDYGTEHFEESMAAQYELTKRFTAEFSIRAFLELHPERTLSRLKQWASDPSEHVRRLVSEGTRPRLPWAPRLRAFQKDPKPVLKLLELLKDDPSLYVRRSVANNLNDIGKDHPELLVATARKWMRGASINRKWIVRHALRSAVKRGDIGALRVLGFGGEVKLQLREVSITPARARKGGAVAISFALRNATQKTQRVNVDYCVHYVKANGSTSAKVFKIKQLSIGAGETVKLAREISLKEMTTRKHYAGVHRVEVLLNGVARRLGEFVVN